MILKKQNNKTHLIFFVFFVPEAVAMPYTKKHTRKENVPVIKTHALLRLLLQVENCEFSVAEKTIKSCKHFKEQEKHFLLSTYIIQVDFLIVKR